MGGVLHQWIGRRFKLDKVDGERCTVGMDRSLYGRNSYGLVLFVYPYGAMGGSCQSCFSLKINEWRRMNVNGSESHRREGK